jgi:hypothetical protein
MTHDEFVSGYRAGKLTAHVNRSLAMHVCDRKDLMPGSQRFAHQFWKGIDCLLPIIGLILLFFLPWWIGAIMIVAGFISMPILQKTAAGFVLDHALEDEAFFNAIQQADVLRVSNRG